MLRHLFPVMFLRDRGCDEKGLIRLLDMADDTPEDRGGSTLEHYHYPEPHEPHPVSRCTPSTLLHSILPCFTLSDSVSGERRAAETEDRRVLRAGAGADEGHSAAARLWTRR